MACGSSDDYRIEGESDWVDGGDGARDGGGGGVVGGGGGGEAEDEKYIKL